MVGTVIVIAGEVVRPSQLIASVGRTKRWGWGMARATGLLTICLAICALPGVSQTSRKSADEIKQADKEWLAAVVAKDLDRSVSFWADDAVVQPPGQPAVVGAVAIRQYVSEGFRQPGFSVTWQSSEPIVSSSGDMAYTLSSNQFTFQDPQGKLVTIRGKGVVVWRRQSDGRWKCAVDSWNPEPEGAVVAGKK
jgi:ketosteroid isomerase-like protein